MSPGAGAGAGTGGQGARKWPIGQGLANGLALGAFIVLLVLGIGFLIHEHPSFGPPEKVVTVLETTNGPGTGKRSNSVSHEPGKGHPVNKTSRTFEHEHQKRSHTKTRTKEVGARSFVERALGSTGLIALQVAVVVLAAFLGAALLQRALLGEFAIKVGNIIELGAVKAEGENTSKLTAEVTDLAKSSKAQKEAVESLTKLVEGSGEKSAELVKALQKLQGEMGDLSARVSKIPGQGGT